MVITSFEIDFVADATNQRENACNKALTAHKVCKARVTLN